MEREEERGTEGLSSAKAEVMTAREIKELTHDVRKLRDNKYFFENENRKLRGRVETLKAELSGADMVISSLTTDILALRARIDGFPDYLWELETKKDGLLVEINRCQSGVKTAANNIKNFLTMRGHLERELMDIINEKAIVLKKLRDMERGVQMVEEQKAEKMPHLKEYDMVLRQLSKVFREVENRMDVSIKFSTKKMP
jgi:predicted  nucleic acid-binding Zn-ribbon protein